MRDSKDRCRFAAIRFYSVFIFVVLPIFIPDSQARVKTEGDSLKSKRIRVFPVPAFGYSPETSTYVGAVTLFSLNLYNDSLTRTSNAKAEFNYTWKNQYITDLDWEFYTRKERFYFKGRISFSRYPDLYYGIGETTRPSDEIKFDSRRVMADINLLKFSGRKWYWGVVLRYNQYTILNSPPDSLQPYPEIASASIPGYGFRLMKDRRNSLLNCTKGKYEDIVFTINHDKGRKYYSFGMDARYYYTFKQVHTVAFRYLSQFTFNNPPFFDLALLGGDKQVRGYYSGRYRENNLLSVQSEYRTILYRRWGAAVFGGISKLAHDLERMHIDHLKVNYGAGLRFVIDRKEKISLRLDYARGNKGSDGFYISFGEAF